MATELEGNEKLQQFIQLLCDLNHQSADFLKTGDVQLLYAMNDTVEAMYAIQHEGKEDAYTAIEEEAQCIYQNFNAIIMMLQSNENDELDEATSQAVRKFAHNIF